MAIKKDPAGVAARRAKCHRKPQEATRWDRLRWLPAAAAQLCLFKTLT